MCNLYLITTNQAAIAALSASSTAMSATSHRCPASSLGRNGLGYGRDADHAGTSDRHRRGDHTDRHHAQRIEVKRDAGAPVSPNCKNDINGKATVCDYCHRDVTGISP